MEKKTKEWFLQSEYDMDTAEFLLKGGRTVYAVFMCHLSVEKALKGLYFEKLKAIPPKSHNLVNLLNSIGIKPPEDMSKVLLKLNETNLVTRYPDKLHEIQKIYNKKTVKGILNLSKVLVQWIKNQLLTS